MLVKSAAACLGFISNARDSDISTNWTDVVQSSRLEGRLITASRFSSRPPLSDLCVGYFFTPVELSLFLSGDAAGVTLSSVVSGWSFMLLRDPLNALFGTADFFLAYIALSICFAPRSFDKSAVKSMLLGLPLIVGFFFKLGAVNSPVGLLSISNSMSRISTT